MSVPNSHKHSPRQTLDRIPAASRSVCWRAECRAKYGNYRTIVYRDNLIFARCHHETYGAEMALRAELWKHLQASA